MTKQQRKTAQRKARQAAALTDLKRVAPGAAYARAPMGTLVEVQPHHLRALPQRAKQRLVEGFKSGWRAPNASPR